MIKPSIVDIPDLNDVSLLSPGIRRCYIGAYGFEKRSLGWTAAQFNQGSVVQKAFIFRYLHAKGRNRIRELRHNLKMIGVEKIQEVSYDVWLPFSIEEEYDSVLFKELESFEEIIIDITAMTKFLILVSLCKLMNLRKRVRIVYTEADDYAPTFQDFEDSKEKMSALARFPNRGFGSIFRAKCLSSIRMQGQPVTLIAFTSFNEQLIRHMLGTISPYRLIFINGRPPRPDFRWRELATREIHSKLLDEFVEDNPLDPDGNLQYTTSSLYYKETIEKIEELYNAFGLHERIMVAATGSKMQTVGLFFAKTLHPDIHIEYPTPDSYFIRGMSLGVRKVYEIVIPNFFDLISTLQKPKFEAIPTA